MTTTTKPEVIATERIMAALKDAGMDVRVGGVGGVVGRCGVWGHVRVDGVDVEFTLDTEVEEEEQEEEEEEEEGSDICGVCNGSGEGIADGTRCRACKGWGEVRI